MSLDIFTPQNDVLCKHTAAGKKLASLSQGVHLVFEAVEEGGAEEELCVDPLLFLLTVEQEDVTAQLPEISLS